MPASPAFTCPIAAKMALPGWLPDPVRRYLSHTEEGISLRALARRGGVNASTVLRQVRRYENRRDDPLMDGALEALRPDIAARTPLHKELPMMTAHLVNKSGLDRRAGALAERQIVQLPDDDDLLREARRLLRRLAEPGAVLAFAPDMEKAVILRQHPDGRSTRTAILERRVAQAFSLKDWISCRKNGRVSTYEISPVGRATLRQLLEEEGAGLRGLSEAAGCFSGPHGAAARLLDDSGGARRIRIALGESPVVVLARRLDRDGRPFLAPPLVQAAERLREDYELAQLSRSSLQSAKAQSRAGLCQSASMGLEDGAGEGAAAERVARALSELGPGLGDVVLRVCCQLEGVEAAERRMGWAARSGKIVLRIALQRLQRHYEDAYGKFGPLIG